MEMLWFWLVSVMIAIYAMMDGFDFGAGILHLFVAKTNDERRQVLAAIGPWWDGNEVWLLAGGGALFLAFPKVLASGFSGFYLAMFLVLWCLVLRGIGIEFRSHLRDGMWRAFWDAVFAVASILLPILLGAALGNVVRGVPIDATGYFNIPLFTSFGIHNPVGILDWYTVLMGVFVLVTIAGHGATFLGWKTDGRVHARAVNAGLPLWSFVIILWLVMTAATLRVTPALFHGWATSPLAWLATLIYIAGLGAVMFGLFKGRHLLAFIGSGAFILGILAATAASVWPVMLRSTLNPEWSLTAHNASVAASGLRKGFIWWIIGFPIALGYFAMLFRLFRGKAQAAGEGEGY
ncbi:MAG: cytochrome d ubiquinol oxidase subunit II [Holophaga sp.]|nr:cytochrome d ubiquinol oxidase subunit II [Holophaga sp.]